MTPGRETVRKATGQSSNPAKTANSRQISHLNRCQPTWPSRRAKFLRKPMFRRFLLAAFLASPLVALAQSAPPKSAPMEFSDEPKFAIAGVTDWTAVGGHGSDST